MTTNISQKVILTISSLFAILLALLILGTFISVVFESRFDFSYNEGDFSIILFTIWQAFLSALVSTFLAIPIARAFARRNFFLKDVLLSFLGAPFILPIIIAVVGFIMIFGRSGYLNDILITLGFPRFSIYGLHGIILVHTFFNLPLAIRLIFNGWLSIPPERFRLAAQVNLSSRSFFRFVELPMLKSVIPGIFLVIFIICLSSFMVALSFGGGPKATTIELAIYQAFRFDFDLGRASVLALFQFAICSIAILISIKLTKPKFFSPSLGGLLRRWDIYSFFSRLTDFIWISSTVCFISLPIFAIFLNGIMQVTTIADQIFEPAIRSVIMALCSASSATIVAFSLGYAAVTINSNIKHIYEVLGYFSISLSPLLLGTGLFILIMPFANPNQFALLLIVLVNALMAIPFVLRILLPPLQNVVDDFGKLSQSVGLNDWYFIKLVILPKLARPIGFSFGLAAAISVGDFGVIALFSLSDSATLPMALYSLMGSYRLEDAAAVAIILLIISFGLFMISDWGGRRFAQN